jgi:hypothetical protein
MRGDIPSSAERDLGPGFPDSPYALEVSLGGSLVARYRLSKDKPTWIGRSPHQSSEDYEYIHVPTIKGPKYHCLFEWDANAERWGLTIQAAVWINGEDVPSPHPNLPKQPRLLSEGDVIVVSGESRGPRCVRVTLVRVGEERINKEL